MEQTPAILLRKTPWSETSLHCLADRAIRNRANRRARSARAKSPFAGRLDFSTLPTLPSRLAAKAICIPCAKSALKSVFDVADAGSAGFYLASYFGELAGIAAPSMHPAPEVFDLMQRGIDFVQRAPASLKALNHFEKELCRILGVHDPAGEIPAIDALGSLYGTIPASREMALKFFV